MYAFGIHNIFPWIHQSLSPPWFIDARGIIDLPQVDLFFIPALFITLEQIERRSREGERERRKSREVVLSNGEQARESYWKGLLEIVESESRVPMHPYDVFF